MRPLSCSKARFTSFETANESCVSRTTSVGSLPTATAGDESSGRDDGSRAPERPKASHASPPGRIASRTPDLTRTRARSAVKTFETPRVDPGSSGLARERVLEPRRRHAFGGAARPRPARAALPRSLSKRARRESRGRARRRRARRSPRRRSDSSRGAERTTGGGRGVPRHCRRPGRVSGASATASSSASSRSVASFAAG